MRTLNRMTDLDFLGPFVLSIEPQAAERQGPTDLYPPGAAEPRPAVVIVHGGPIPEQLRPTPRDWPVYRGYASALAERGLFAAVVDHRLHSPTAYHLAADDVTAAIEAVRADPRVDADRVALWFFSGGGLLLADWLRAPAPWLRCVAATYPVLAPLPGWPVEPRFLPSEALAGAGGLPVVLTRVGKENPLIAAGVDGFVAAAGTAGTPLHVVDVPDGRHGFDYLDHTDQSRDAVRSAVDLVAGAVRAATMAGRASLATGQSDIRLSMTFSHSAEGHDHAG